MSEAVLALKDVAWASAGVFVALITGCIAVYGSVRFGLIPGVKGLKLTLEKIEAASVLIDAQLRPNGGGSVLDRVDATHALVKHIDDVLAAGCPLFGDSGMCPRGLSPGQEIGNV